ncbi:SPOR domain-containing protein [Dyella acidiphila]|uniref:SPOR domain-containing protein n=1 Tax=Dyella acidiphila TaxID=2775866 RepID=A0ABR9GFG6_9GAMM|nr:SPOR domain-containing protein [Dyella acidiphila]MBE1162714.1 SPOR domain-containing protein [Dyella acidiphila]
MNTRLLGAAVLVALAILFVPMMFSSKSPSTSSSDQSVSLAIPAVPDRDLQTKTMSLTGQPAASASVAPATTAAPNASGMSTVATQPAPSASAPAIATPVPQQAAAQPPQPAIATPLPKTTVASNRPAIAPPAAIAPPPATPALPPATAGRGIYSVNLSAYAPDGANRLMTRVRGMGYPVRSEPIQRAGKTLTLVSAGPFETRAAAEAARLKIAQTVPGIPARLESGATTPQGDVPAPAAGSTPARAGAWAVQVAAMGSQADAMALRDKLRASGFDGFVDSVNAGGKQLWRVRAGPQTQRSDAMSLRDQIKAKLGLDGNVVRAN